MSQEIRAGFISENLSPDAFHRYACDCYKCKQDFNCPDSYFSPVPYFLLCRAIELGIKSRLLRDKPKAQNKKVKEDIGHNLCKAYNRLDPSEQVLTAAEEAILKQANDIYSKKELEYEFAEHTLSAFSQYPDLKALDSIAKKLIEGVIRGSLRH